ncbi:indole-3-glycerol phosphate synthase [Striga asiatica]|uniref:indole-3-glycerol-phosphate synthase n=1 Tax=Striga asiatica TaxID=4170 RepID=A0A5A7PZZ9_STRAF|nr:indole-3-glycerol phosphate synthase [Striga asiatica]
MSGQAIFYFFLLCLKKFDSNSIKIHYIYSLFFSLTGARSFHRRSLHHIGDEPNPYEQAISIIGRTLSKFDEDNLIPCFGFGDEICEGFEEVLSRYRELVPQLRLAGPTSFAPVIEMAITIVEQSGGQYHVLLIIADGQVTRSVGTARGQLSPQEKRTVDAIVKASDPLSIILVGVGDGPWDFVNFTEIMSKNTDLPRKEAEFALSALMEIPSQYKATLELNILGATRGNGVDRVALPPPLYGANSVSTPKTSQNGIFRPSEPSRSQHEPAVRTSQLQATKDGSAIVSEATTSEGNALKIKELEATIIQDEVASSQGIKIRRRPPTGQPLHYVGPFEFRLQNEGNTPRNILEEIVWNKDVEVSQMKERKPLSTLKKLLDNAPPVRDFIGALKGANTRTGLPGLIAEVKKASPSRGVLREDFDPVQIAKAYEKGGAACLSVLTDEKYFQGSFENLEAIRKSGVQCPLLCKEFVVDAWQIFYARVKGADAILLIAAVLPDLDIKYMIKICKLLGLTALVEVHDELEMDRVLEIDGIELVGINNRDLGTFEVDITNTKKLLEGERGQRIIEKGISIVGESGLFTPADIAYVHEAGVKAVLVGESIVKQKDPCAGIAQLFVLSKIFEVYIMKK